MKEMVLAALRRKRETAEKAGFADQIERIDARLAEAEAAQPTAAAAEPKVEEPDAELGVDLTGAAFKRAGDLGLTAADFKRRRPSGKTGFTVDDVERIAEARDKANPTTTEEETT